MDKELGDKIAVMQRQLKEIQSCINGLQSIAMNGNDVIHKEVADLREYKRQQESRLQYKDIADFDEKLLIHGTKSHIWRQEVTSQNWECEVTWKQLFMSIAPYLLDCPNDRRVESLLKSITYSYVGKPTSDTLIAKIFKL